MSDDCGVQKKKPRQKHEMCGTLKRRNQTKKTKKTQTGNSVIMFSTVEYVPPSWVLKQFMLRRGTLVRLSSLWLVGNKNDNYCESLLIYVVLLSGCWQCVMLLIPGRCGGSRGAVDDCRHFLRQPHMVGLGLHTLWTLVGSVPSRKTSWWSSKGWDGGLLMPAELKGWDAVLWALHSSLPLGMAGTLELKFR